MPLLKPPMLIDAFRLSAPTVAETIDNIIKHYSTAPGGWNHQRCLRPIMQGYSGATDVAALISGCKGTHKPSELDNAKIVEAVLPKVIGRPTQCFDYKRKYYPITPSLRCAMGPSFFIVERGVIKLVYVHARNTSRASLANLAGMAAILKTDILDQDFYGEPTDVEIHYVDKKGTARNDTVLNLSALANYLVEPAEVTLQRFALALVDVMENDRLTPQKRDRKQKPARDDGQITMDV
jgi:hypothetical protein